MLKGLEQDILRIVSRKLVTEPLGGAITDMFKGGSSAGGIGGALSNVFSSIFGGFRAAGGGVSPGMAYVVGEDGPELFTPRSGGQIVPNKALAGTVTHRSMVIHINPPSGMNSQTSNQFAADVARQLRMADVRNN